MGEEAKSADDAAAELLSQLSLRFPFGPAFFVSHLGAFVRDRCPNPEEHLPLVEVHLQNGELLRVCHVIGLSPRWVALAVREGEKAGGAMRTELVPYEVICRVTIRPIQPGRQVAGFGQADIPPFFTGEIAPEATLAAAARHPIP
jgi:hypothetical protein